MVSPLCCCASGHLLIGLLAALTVALFTLCAVAFSHLQTSSAPAHRVSAAGSNITSDGGDFLDYLKAVEEEQLRQQHDTSVERRAVEVPEYGRHDGDIVLGAGDMRRGHRLRVAGKEDSSWRGGRFMGRRPVVGGMLSRREDVHSRGSLDEVERDGDGLFSAAHASPTPPQSLSPPKPPQTPDDQTMGLLRNSLSPSYLSARSLSKEHSSSPSSSTRDIEPRTFSIQEGIFSEMLGVVKHVAARLENDEELQGELRSIVQLVRRILDRFTGGEDDEDRPTVPPSFVTVTTSNTWILPETTTVTGTHATEAATTITTFVTPPDSTVIETTTTFVSEPPPSATDGAASGAASLDDGQRMMLMALVARECLSELSGSSGGLLEGVRSVPRCIALFEKALNLAESHY